MALTGLADPFPLIIPLTPAQGGTGISSYTIGDLIYASATTTLSKLADVAVGSALISGGVATAPSWSTSMALLSTIASKQAAAAGISLDHNSATGNFTLRLSPANVTANRRWSFPDRDDTAAGLAAQTFTGTQTISGTSSLPASGQVTIGGGVLTAYNASGDSIRVIQAAGSTARFSVGCVDASDTNGRLLVSWAGATDQGAINSYKNGVYRPLAMDASAFTFGQGGVTISLTTGTTLTVSSTNAAAIACSGGISATLATLATGTITASAPAINATQTWNAGAVTFTGWKLNVTNTASAAASLLLDLQVGGTSKFNVTLLGGLVNADTTDATAIGTAANILPGGLSVAKSSYLGTVGSTFKGNLIAGVQDGTAAVSGQVGEGSNQSATGVAVAATGAVGNVTSLALGPGDWMISVLCVISGGATGLTAGSVMKVSLVTTTATNGTEGTTMATQSIAALTANGKHCLSIPGRRVSISASTTYYLTEEVTYAAGSPTAAGYINATRVR